MHHQSSIAPVMHYSSHNVSLSPPQHPPARTCSGQPVHSNLFFSKTFGNLRCLFGNSVFFPFGYAAGTSGTVFRCLQNHSWRIPHRLYCAMLLKRGKGFGEQTEANGTPLRFLHLLLCVCWQPRGVTPAVYPKNEYCRDCSPTNVLRLPPAAKSRLKPRFRKTYKPRVNFYSDSPPRHQTPWAAFPTDRLKAFGGT